ncbi:MAG: DUF917 domain-containing protein [Actinomycetota bacterium]
MIEIGLEELEWLTLGAAVFGAGGGGDPLLGSLMASRAISESGPVQLVDLDDLDGDDLIVPAAMVGAPTVMTEKFASGDEGDRLIAALEAQLGKRVAAFCSGELGGINGVLPVTWAARSGLPIVDCDLMGRAFPELQMTTAALAGVDISPVIMTDERANIVSFTTVTPKWAETLVRTVVGAMGGEASMCLYPMTVAEARTAAVPRSMSRAMEVGRILLEATDDPIGALCAAVEGFPLMEGKVADVDRQTTAGFARGTATIEGTGPDSGRLLRMEFQNENAVVMEDGKVLASVPDIITAVDIHTARPIVTELLRYGQRVALIALPCDPVWRSDEALAVAGPRAFNYDIDYVPVEVLHG